MQMTAQLNDRSRAVVEGGQRLQITMSPYYGESDFSGLDSSSTRGARIDPVSLADLLRNGFVYAPHSIFERSEEHTSELQSLMRISYAVFCLKKKNRIVQ